jgi:hypothetical protein|tara:strand:- start:4067 stop:4204 length:138 start_codon:yes stop_codon:yes gene_type:complete
VGHPKWLCKNKDKSIKNKKYVEKNIEYYLKLKESKWSDIINNVKF